MAEPPRAHGALRAYVHEVVDAAADLPPRIDSWARLVDVEFSRHLSRAGLVGITWPRAYGGGDRSYVDRLVVTEELLRLGAPVAAHWMGDRQIGPAILRHGSDELKAELLPPMVRSEALFCLGMSEPEAGSDLAGVRTSARLTTQGWRLSGHKTWTSHAHHATHAYVLARTDPAAHRHAGLTELVVDLGTPGVTISPILDVTGGHHFNEVRFDEVLVPHHRVLGEVGSGWQQVVEQLSFERGGPERYLSTVPLFEALVASGIVDPATMGRLVAMLAALRTGAYRVAEHMDRGAAPVVASAALKYLGNRFEQQVVEAARPLAAEPGPLGDLVAYAALVAPGFSIRGGAAEVLVSIVAKETS